MSRIRSKLPSSGGGEVAKPIYDNFDQRSKDELLDDLTDWLDTADEKNFDEERLDALLGALNEKDPQEDFDAEAHYAQFRQKFQPLFETNDAKPAAKHSRKTFRKLIPIAAVIALLLAGTITAQAFGLDIFGAIARWTSSTFGFSNSDEPYATIGHYPIAEGETKEYASLQEALDDFQVSGQLAPTWVPERFELESVTAKTEPAGAEFRGMYSSINGESLLIKLKEYNSADQTDAEKDKSGVDFFVSGGIRHYFANDKTACKVIWTNGEVEGRITGNVNQDELKEIILSIYER